MALILHDGFKQGKEVTGHTAFDHPLVVAKFIFENIDNIPMRKVDVLQVIRLIKSHMGPWNVDKAGNEVLPIPKLDDEKFVHACDYLASREFLEMKFVDNEIMSRNEKKKILKNDNGGTNASRI